MDQKLVAWARAVKSRNRTRSDPTLPPLWLFTDPDRGASLDAIAALPRGLCGVVFRHDADPDRPALLRAAARLCRVRRLLLTVAGSGPLPPGAGRHLRGGHRPAATRPGPWTTASVHSRIQLVRASRAGVRCAFLSPAFPTATHPGASGLGPRRWSALARHTAIPVLALGGLTGQTARSLTKMARGAAAITALTPEAAPPPRFLCPLGHSVSRLP